MASICDFVSKFDSKLKNMKFSASLRLCGGKATFFQTSHKMESQFVVFELGEEYYGVNIAAVESIIKLQAITKMPHSLSFVEGITNLRGKVIPVIDLRKRFSLSSISETKDTRIIVIGIDTVTTGMIVDAVTEVLRVSDNDIEQTPMMVSAVDSAFITGIAKVDGRLIVLLDLRKILSTEEKIDLQEAIV